MEGISYNQLQKRYISRSAALDYRQTWTMFSNRLFKVRATRRNFLQDGEITPSLRSDDGLLPTNLQQRYKVPSIAKHLFEESRHLRDSTDDITDNYDIGFSSILKSNVQSSDRSFKNEVEEALDVCIRLFETWEHVFNCHSIAHDRIESSSKMQEKNRPYWVAYIMDDCSANVPILASPNHQATDQQMIEIMQTFTVLHDRSPGVLLLQSGTDATTTKNVNWRDFWCKIPYRVNVPKQVRADVCILSCSPSELDTHGVT